MPYQETIYEKGTMATGGSLQPALGPIRRRPQQTTAAVLDLPLYHPRVITLSDESYRVRSG